MRRGFLLPKPKSSGYEPAGLRQEDCLKRHDLEMKSLMYDAPRVTGYTIDGMACIFNNLSRHEGDLTMPSKFRVKDVHQEWIRMATKEETSQHGKWYHLLNFKPAAVIHSSGQVAGLYDTLGLVGNRITVLAQVPVATFNEVPCADIDDVPTPPTPPPF